MKKDTLTEIILGTIGGLIFAIGMCMCLIAKCNMMKIGIIVAIIGFIILLCMIPVYHKTHSKQAKHLDWSIIGIWVIGIVGALILGLGMSKIMTGEVSQIDMIVGIIIGTIGLLICILNYPIYAYIKSKKI